MMTASDVAAAIAGLRARAKAGLKFADYLSGADPSITLEEAQAAAQLFFGETASAASSAPALDRRDQLIRSTLEKYDGRPSRRAKDMASDWAAYIAAAWPRERISGPPDSSSERRRALHELSRLNNGEALSWQQLLNIAEGHRGAKTF